MQRIPSAGRIGRFFFEIDRSVKKIVDDPKRFTFLRDARGKFHIELGDARVLLQESKDTYGLLVIDAFNTQAIPIHLLTREAIALYRKRLLADGISCFTSPTATSISNQSWGTQRRTRGASLTFAGTSHRKKITRWVSSSRGGW